MQFKFKSIQYKSTQSNQTNMIPIQQSDPITPTHFNSMQIDVMEVDSIQVKSIQSNPIRPKSNRHSIFNSIKINSMQATSSRFNSIQVGVYYFNTS